MKFSYSEVIRIHEFIIESFPNLELLSHEDYGYGSGGFQHYYDNVWTFYMVPPSLDPKKILKLLDTNKDLILGQDSRLHSTRNHKHSFEIEFPGGNSGNKLVFASFAFLQRKELLRIANCIGKMENAGTFLNKYNYTEKGCCTLL